uniref:BOS complex subunit TMEM147 n=1 Tax=Trichuris muris TaxID=70415 RepID=A0A5S6QN92_TRIMR
MTFFHFLNCMLLAFAPYGITYLYSGIAEYTSVWKCFQSGLAYFATQLAKMLAWATFYPSTEQEGIEFNLFPEFMKASVNVLDLLGLFMVISRSWSGRGEVRFLTAGLGWAAADCFATRIIPFWTGALGIEFDWKYLQMGIESNLNLVYYTSLATLLWLWNRRDLNANYKPILLAFFTFATFKTFLTELMMHRFLLLSWKLLLVQLFMAIASAACAVGFYSTLRQDTSSKY